MRLFILMPFLTLMCITPVKAHGDLDIRIQAVTSDIESNPDSAHLYFVRGKLRFQHEEYDLAVTDINTSMDKGYIHDLQKIYLSKSHYRLQQYDLAEQLLNEFLSEDPDNVVGLKLKGRILFAQENFEASALAFEKVISLTIKSLPENYLEAVLSWKATSHPERYARAVSVLQLGLKKLGPIVTLQNQLIDLHLESGNGHEAIAIQKGIIEKTNRKESAYFKLAEIYLSLKDNEGAKNALEQARSAMTRLPARIRQNKAMRSLEDQIEQHLTNLI